MVQRCMTCSFGLFVHALRCGVSLGSKKSSRKFCFYLKYNSQVNSSSKAWKVLIFCRCTGVTGLKNKQG